VADGVGDSVAARGRGVGAAPARGALVAVGDAGDTDDGGRAEGVRAAAELGATDGEAVAGAVWLLPGPYM
jgi:hypothetical protein